jgi:hypothetical protein
LRGPRHYATLAPMVVRFLSRVRFIALLAPLFAIISALEVGCSGSNKGGCYYGIDQDDPYGGCEDEYYGQR